MKPIIKKFFCVLLFLTPLIGLHASGTEDYFGAAKHAVSSDALINNPLGLNPADWVLTREHFSTSYTIVQYSLQRTQTVLTIVTVLDVDSLETITPTFTSNSNPEDYFDASVYNTPQVGDLGQYQKDSTVVGVTTDGGVNDSALVVLMGTTDANITALRLDTLPTNKTTFLQRGLDINEQNKYIMPYWGVLATGVAIQDGTIRVYFLNVHIK